jgi:uncharacterized protein (UPF0261 family)
VVASTDIDRTKAGDLSRDAASLRLPNVPAKFADRKFYQRNQNVTLMRLTKMESAQLGEIFATKLNAYSGPVTVLLSQKVFSVIGEPGKPFHDPFADEAFFQAMKHHLKKSVPVVEMDCPVSAPEFARACAEALLENMDPKAVKAGRSRVNMPPQHH